jgi:diketogulonate reductase-like aldo/keto reductase
VLLLEYKELAKGVKIPVLGLGTWGLVGTYQADYSSDAKAIASLKAGIELGMTHIDTAENYGAGHAEELIGEAIAPFGREDLFITTKVYRNHLHFQDMIDALKNSLNRLKLDYVDLFLIHWPNPDVPLSETMRGLEFCAQEGLTNFIGVSNFPLRLLKEAESCLKDHRLVADQVCYNLTRFSKTLMRFPRPFETKDYVHDVHLHCIENDMMLIAYSPLEEGKLTRPEYPVLDEIADKYGKTRTQVALNWLISQEKIVAVPKAVDAEHIKENVGALGWRMSKEDFNRLQESFAPRGTNDSLRP